MVAEENQSQFTNLEAFSKSIADKLAEYQELYKQTSKKISQADVELKQLTQKNIAITSDLQKAQKPYSELNFDEIKTIYEAALESQQKLFLQRIQIEKLQNDLNHQQMIIENFESQIGDIQNLIQYYESRSKVNANIDLVKMMVEAQEDERQTLSRQMHDGPAQILSNLILQSEIALRLFELDKDKAKNELTVLNNSATETFKDIREFITYLKPIALTDFGLTSGIKRFVEHLNSNDSLRVTFKTTGKEKKTAPFEELLIFRTCQKIVEQAINSRQASQVETSIEFLDNNINLIITDNGREIEDEDIIDVQFKIQQQRIQLLGGDINIEKNDPSGNCISIQVPIIM